MLNKFIKKTILPVAVAGVIMFSGTNVNALGSVELAKGMKDDNVLILQEDLKELGLFNVKETTNYFGYYTELAIKELQRSKGLEETGTYNKETHEVLNQLKEEILQERIENGEILGYERTLYKDFQGEDVTRVQKKLSELGYLEMDEFTDIYCKDTIEAVQLFQKTYDLEPDGATGKRVVNLINQISTGEIEALEPAVEEEVEENVNEDILSIANSLRGARYSYGATGPNAFDCSGFTQTVFRRAGVNIPRSSRQQANYGTRVAKSDLRPGDLVLFAGTGGRSGISHVGIYIGEGRFIHCSTSRGVVTDSLNSGYYNSRYSHGQRVR